MVSVDLHLIEETDRYILIEDKEEPLRTLVALSKRYACVTTGRAAYRGR
jgi:hypothetical protein